MAQPHQYLLGGSFRRCFWVVIIPVWISGILSGCRFSTTADKWPFLPSRYARWKRYCYDDYHILMLIDLRCTFRKFPRLTAMHMLFRELRAVNDILNDAKLTMYATVIIAARWNRLMTWPVSSKVSHARYELASKREYICRLLMPRGGISYLFIPLTYRLPNKLPLIPAGQYFIISITYMIWTLCNEKELRFQARFFIIRISMLVIYIYMIYLHTSLLLWLPYYSSIFSLGTRWVAAWNAHISSPTFFHLYCLSRRCLDVTARHKSK